MNVFKLLSYNKQIEENNIYIPNEIFQDLKESITISKHIGFAYCYYYLITYLYQFAKYGGAVKITKDVLKSILGYNPNYKKVDYIIKEEGILNQIGYTKSSITYPVNAWIVTDNGLPYPDFFYNDEFNSEFKKYLHKGLIIDVPVKAFERDGDNGTFYDIRNTHSIPVSTFFCLISHPNLGTTGAYIYGYLKWKNDMFENGYGRSLIDLAAEIGIPERSLTRYLNQLEENGFIKIKRSTFVVGLNEEDRKPNIYITLSPSFYGL